MKILPAKYLLPLAAALSLSSLAKGERAPTFGQRIEEKEALSATEIDGEFLAPKQKNWIDRISLGTYGEAHFGTGDQFDEFDIHRLVLFLGYDFTDKIRFITEIELEHLYSDNPGTDLVWVLEQAYFEFDLGKDLDLQAGGLLVPLGTINEIHEPIFFYGVERNRIETEIIPSTWTEFGLNLRKTYDSGLQWDLALHRGLNVETSDFNKNGPDLRNGRQKTDTFENNTGAATARIRYTGINGLELGAGFQYQNDISAAAGRNSAFLSSGHFVYTTGGFSLRGLAANWNIGGETSVGGTKVAGSEIDNQYGGYLEPSYKWSLGKGMSLGLFSRALYWKNEDAPAGQTEYSCGINFWPTENIVIKADYVHEDRAGGKEDQNNFNFGVGFSF